MEQNQVANESARASLELLYGISRELASALDLRTVLHRVLFLSMKNVGAVSGSIVVIDDHGQVVESAFLMIGQAHDQTMLQLRVTYERGLAGWVARNRQAALISDTSRDERWLRRPDDSAERTGPKSAVSVPILTRDKLVGVITLVHPQPGFFATDHLELVQAIADQAGIAILNARLYAESQRRARVMTAVAESAAVITASLNLDDVLYRILEQISQALEVEGVFLALVDSDRQELEFRASTMHSARRIIGKRVPIGQGIAGWVAKEGQALVVPEVEVDPRYSAEVDHHPGLENRAMMCAPIHSDGQVIGVLEVLDPLKDAFEADDLLVLNGIGSMAGTAIRHAQLFENLQAAHQRYRDLFEDSIDPILITDWDGHILEANRPAEQTIGLTSEQLHTLTISDVHRVDDEKVGVKFKNLLSGETISYESILRAQTGREFPIQAYARSIRGEGRAQIQWMLRDISERKGLDNLREDLTAMVYHDLRSPLSNVISSLQVLESMLPAENDAAVRSMLNIALRSTDRVQRLTNSLLDINRLEAGQKIGNRVPMLPADLVKDAMEAVLPTARHREIVIDVDVSQALPQVSVDADMIRRVLINLLENAIKFTPTRGKIWVEARRETGFVRFSVTDSGPGIAPADQERIFEKFTRLSVSQGPRGLGLGLAFCRLALAGHGGRIWVESKAGAGARFQFVLPYAIEAPAPA
jgi:two-component system, NtrC family, sensor histidine kinase KinB